MPTFCAVINCGTLGGRGIPMYRFPSKYDNRGRISQVASDRLEKWILALKRADLTASKIKYERVCGKHFISGKKAELEDVNNPDWVPCLNMGYKESSDSKCLERFNRVENRNKRKEADKLVLTSASTSDHDSINTNNQSIQSCQSITTGTEEISVKDLELALTNANEEVYNLREELEFYKYNRNMLAKSDAKCLYYTGLPNINYVDAVYDLVETFLNENHCSKLTKYEQLILTLMKLRNNFDFIELGYKFKVDRRTASRCFHNCLWILYRRLNKFIIWPSREILQQNMPLVFQETFGNKIACIIDCFEIFIERPSALQAKSQTFSNYKHHNTVKFLIGITPHGVISFISAAFGGRCSDKFITENCGFLEKLLPGDKVLTDRGFLINSSVNLYMAEVITPAFLKGRKQLAPIDVEQTRKIAHLRIHVERIISSLRQKYKIISDQVPITILNEKNNITTIDQIVSVCCALTNLCPSIVSCS